MNFLSFDDLANAVRQNMGRIPHDIDVVVGVPRSGLLPAAMIALYRNTALTDVEGLLKGRALQPGLRRAKPKLKAAPSAWRKVLVVDDSVHSGQTLRRIRAQIEADERRFDLTLCAVFGLRKHHRGVDLVMSVVESPRIFEWNFLHNPYHMADACVDIDGLLCLDPTHEENDDGPKYGRFVADAVPYLLPSVPVGAIVSSRLERYRASTEAWLRQHGVSYRDLCLLDLPSAEERRRTGAHVPFKARVYREHTESRLFLESEPDQARLIAAMTGKAVICTTNMTLYDESGPRRVVRILRSRGSVMTRLVRNVLQRLPRLSAAWSGRGGE